MTRIKVKKVVKGKPDKPPGQGGPEPTPPPGDPVSGKFKGTVDIDNGEQGKAVEGNFSGTCNSETGEFDVMGVLIAAVGGGPVPVISTPLPAVSPSTATAGAVLSCSTGTWTNSPTSYAYQWMLGGSDISGATSSTYTTPSAGTYTCKVRASNANGPAAGYVTSSNSSVVSAGGGGSFDYTVNNVTELAAALTAIGTGGNKTIGLNDGTYTTDAIRTVFGNRAFSAPVTVSCAQTPKGALFSGPALATYSTIEIYNTTNLTIDGIDVYHNPIGTVLDPTPGTSLGRAINIGESGACSNIIIKNCRIKGNVFPLDYPFAKVDPYPDTPYSGVHDWLSSNVSIIGNEMYYCGNGITSYPGGGVHDYSGNYIHYFWGDGINIYRGQNASRIDVKDNVVIEIVHDNSTPEAESLGIHADFIQCWTISAEHLTANWAPLNIHRNIFIGTVASPAVQAIILQNVTAGFGFDQLSIKGNLIINRGAPSWGIQFQSGRNYQVIGNTVAASTLIPNVFSVACGMLIWPDSTAGVVKNNVSGTITDDSGIATKTNNVLVATDGSTTGYSTKFDGPTWAPTTRAEALAMYNMKVGQDLDLTVNVGAVGSGYVNWAAANPSTTGGSFNGGFE